MECPGQSDDDSAERFWVLTMRFSPGIMFTMIAIDSIPINYDEKEEGLPDQYRERFQAVKGNGKLNT